MADKDELLDHNYDGIQEYDNDLPRWWIAIFGITILYGLYYIVYYHLGPGLFATEQLAVDMKAIEEQRAGATSFVSGEEVREEKLLSLVNDASALVKGKEVYAGKCVACHGFSGEGLIGPNLTDDNWIHGGKLKDIKHIIEVGVLEKGMLAWKGVISDEEINAVTAYIRSLRGSNPPNAKAPEGSLFEDR